MLFYAIGEYTSKLYSLNPRADMAAASVLSYGMTALFWLPALTHTQSISTTGVLWAVLYAVITLMIGVLLFHEPITLIQAAGIVLALISIILINS